MTTESQDQTQSELDALIALRRRFHQNPELAFREFQTTAVICEELHRLGFGVVCGVNFAGRRDFEVTFSGVNAHAGAAPQNGKNALQAACAAVSNLYAISRHSEGASRIGIGRFHSDNAPNVVSDSASFMVEVRGQTMAVLDYMTEQARAVVMGAAAMAGVTACIRPNQECPTAPNSPRTRALVATACRLAGVPADEVLDETNVQGSEDATYLMGQVQARGGQASYVAFGSPFRGGHHHPQWDFDEDLLLRAVGVLWEFCRFASQ